MEIAIAALSSSIDNFIVGFGFGLGKHRLSNSFNFSISLCNAIGALASTFLGAKVGGTSPAVAALLSTIIFLIYALFELSGWIEGKNLQPHPLSSPGSQRTSLRNVERSVAWSFAVPMTMNNLCSGLAGGLSGYDSSSMFIAAFLASYILMAVGNIIGHVGAGEDELELKFNPHAISCCLYFILALMQFYDLCFTLWY